MPSGAKANGKELKIKVDIEQMTIPDLAVLTNMGKLSEKELPDMAPLVEMLERVVVGGVSKIPATALQDVMAALNEAMATVIKSDSEDPEGN